MGDRGSASAPGTVPCLLPAAAADGARRAAARTPQQASARAPSPPARAPRPGLGWSRACRSQRGSWASRAVAAARSWQGVSPGHALASFGASRSLLALTLAAQHQQAPLALAWAAFAATRCARDRGTPAPSRVSKSSAAGAAWFPWFKVRAKRVRRSQCESRRPQAGKLGLCTHLEYLLQPALATLHQVP